jgi:hypothetical protein
VGTRGNIGPAAPEPKIDPHIDQRAIYCAL